jgi:hypothetical protein
MRKALSQYAPAWIPEKKEVTRARGRLGNEEIRTLHLLLHVIGWLYLTVCEVRHLQQAGAGKYGQKLEFKIVTERDSLGDLGADVKTILTWILQDTECVEVDWTQLDPNTGLEAS